MKVKKFLILFVATFFFSFLNVEAFSTSLGIKNEAYLNENITVNINLSNLGSTGLATGQYYLNYDASKVQYIGFNVGQGKPNADYSVSNDGNKVILLYIDNTATDNPLKNGIFATVTFKAIALGQTSFLVSGSGFSTVENGIVDLTTNNSNKSINIINKTTTTTTTKKVETTTTTPTKKVETTTTKKTDSNTTTTSPRTGITNKTTTSPIKIDENNKLSNDNTLKKLIVKNYEINFEKDTLDYSITVPNEVEKIDIEYEINNKNSIVEIVNNDLIIGENEIIIKVIAENKSERIYKIKVIRNNKYVVTNYNKIDLIDLLNSDNKFIEINIDIHEKYKIIEKEILDLIKAKNAEIKFNINDKNKNLYYIIINSENISSIIDYLDLSILSHSNENNIEGLVYDINLKNNKTINNKIKVYFNNVDKSIKNIYLYDIKTFKLLNKININGKYFEADFESGNEYVLLSQEYKSNNSLLTTLLISFILLLILTIILIILVKVKRGVLHEKKSNN